MICVSWNIHARRRTSTDGEQTDGEHPGDIEAVKELINNVIIEGNQAISMAVIHELYDDGHVGDTRYRSRLKQRILDLYPDDLLFLTIDGKTPQIVVSREGTPQIVVSREGITTTSTTNTKEYLLKAAAKALRSEILEYEKSLPDLSWPPQIDVLKERNESIPSLVTNFLDILLKALGHSNSVFTQRLIDSFSQDLVHGVSRGRVITLKHFALGVGMHNITGQKLPIRILYNLGHFIDYESVKVKRQKQKLLGSYMRKERLLDYSQRLKRIVF